MSVLEVSQRQGVAVSLSWPASILFGNTAQALRTCALPLSPACLPPSPLAHPCCTCSGFKPIMSASAAAELRCQSMCTSAT